MNATVHEFRRTLAIRRGQAQNFGVNLFTSFAPATAEKLSQTPSVLTPRLSLPVPNGAKGRRIISVVRKTKKHRKIPSRAATILTTMDKIEPKRFSPKPAVGTFDVGELEKLPIDWSAVLGEHRGWLRSVLAARLGGRDEVDEVWQEVAVAAVSSKSPPTDVERVAPWLYKIAVRRALMYRRSKGRQRRMMQSYAVERAADTSSERNPLDWLLSSERQKLVRQAVGKLHHRDQEMLLLKYVQDWSYAQIADHLGVSNSAVESRLHRARQKLRERLTNDSITSTAS